MERIFEPARDQRSGDTSGAEDRSSCRLRDPGGKHEENRKIHKVSEERFVADWKDTFPETQESAITDIYNEIKLPARATAGSAGYDFYAPVDLTLNPERLSRSLPVSALRWSRTGSEMLSEKRTGIQIPSAAQQYGRNH